MTFFRPAITIDEEIMFLLAAWGANLSYYGITILMLPEESSHHDHPQLSEIP